MSRSEEEVPPISLDYYFGGEREQSGCLGNLCLKDLSTKCLFTCSVPHKGVDAYVVDRVCRFLDSLGYKRIRMRSDQQNAIMALCGAVKDCWSGERIPEGSPVGEHASNGAVEAGIRTAEAQTRALKLQFGGSLQY